MKSEFRVLVCGGRDFGVKVNANRQKSMNKEQVRSLKTTLDAIKEAVELLGMQLVIIQGEAKGADLMGKGWAKYNEIPTMDFKADWETLGKGAGFARNTDMLVEGRPNLVVAFSGGSGTAMMCKIASEAGVQVTRVL